MHLPPPSLRKLSVAGPEIKRFIALGEALKAAIDSVVQNQKLQPQRILDHGCRSGIILRHWKVPIQAVDMHEACVDWCTNAFPQHKIDLIGTRDVLSYEPFDLIYSSLFLNLDESDQLFWINELQRMITHGGLLLILLRTERESLGNLEPEERKKLEAGNLVIRNPSQSGTPECQAFHPKSFIVDRLAQFMPLLQLIPAQTLRIDGFPAVVPSIAILRKIG